MKDKSIIKHSAGFSTLEMLIAFMLVFFFIGAIVSLGFGGQSLGVDSQTDSEAAHKAQEMLETARAAAKNNFDALTSIPAYSEGIYTKSLDVGLLDFNTKQATSMVSWQAEGGRGLSVQLKTIIANPARAGGADTCDPVLAGDWTRPQAWKDGYGYADIVSNTGASGLDVISKKVYLTSDPSDSGKDDFYVIDVSNPKPSGGDLPILGHLSTAYGLTDVRVAGQYAYVAADSAKYQLLVIDISNPTGLNVSNIVAKLDVTASGDTAVGNTLTYSNKKIYLGLTKSSGAEFHIVDVSDPKSLKEIGAGFKVGSAINQILVKNNLAYLATASSSQVLILDISNPSNPHQIDPKKQTLYKPPGWQNWTGQSLALFGNSLYLGRIGGGTVNNKDLFILNASDLSATPAGTMTQSKQSGVSRIVLRGDLLFMSNADPNDGFQIWNVSDPGNLKRYDTTPVNIQQTSTAGMDCEGNFIFIGQRSNRALQIIGPP